MGSTSNALSERFENMPISVFSDIRASSDLLRLLENVAQGPVDARRCYHAAHLGTWEDGWTVVAHVAATDARAAHVAAFRLSSDALAERPDALASMSRGSIVNLLSKALDPWRVHSAATVADLAVTLAAKVAASGAVPEPGSRLWDQAGAVNDFDEGWMLDHVWSLLDTDEQAAVNMLIALGPEPGTVAATLDAIRNFRANWCKVDESEAVIREAVFRQTGLTLTGAGVERTNLPGALMLLPFDEWETTAEHLVAHVVAQTPEMFTSASGWTLEKPEPRKRTTTRFTWPLAA